MRETPAAKHGGARLLVAAAWLQIGLVGAVVLVAALDRLVGQPVGYSTPISTPIRAPIQLLSTLAGGLCGGLLAVASWRQGLRILEHSQLALASAGARSTQSLAHR